jgi:dCMP deaminase
MFLGFTGPNAAGKGEAIRYLVEKKKFIAFSLSDIIREEATRLMLDPTRDNLISIGNDLREAEGPAVLAKRILIKVKNLPQAIVDSIRNPYEIEVLRSNLKDFKLIGITADIHNRFERSIKRGRVGDGETLEEFIKKEERENSTNEKAQQLNKCYELADFKIDNSGSLSSLYKKLDLILHELNYKPYKRLSWDEYFMKTAFLVAERSTCIRHHVGAVIVIDNHLVSTGYNGAPSGIKDCLELGCLRDQMGIKSGIQHEICRAVHAEQNAIIQAALNGSTPEGSTIYCTHSPCIICAKMIVNARIKRFVACTYYPDKTFEDLFKEAGVKVEIQEKPDLTIIALE